MDRDLIEARLESLRRCVERVAAKTPSTAEKLTLDADLQDVIALNLQRAVQRGRREPYHCRHRSATA